MEIPSANADSLHGYIWTTPTWQDAHRENCLFWWWVHNEIIWAIQEMNYFELKVKEPSKRGYKIGYLKWLKTKDDIMNVKKDERRVFESNQTDRRNSHWN